MEAGEVAFTDKTVGDVAGEAAGEVASGAFGDVVEWMAGGIVDVIATTLTWWMEIPLHLDNIGGLSQNIGEFTFQLQVYLLIGSILICAGRLAIAHRRAAIEQAESTFKAFAQVVFIAVFMSGFIIAGTKASDAFSTWIVEEAAGGDPKTFAMNVMSVDLLVSGLGPGLLLVVGIVAILAGLAQAVLLIVRSAFLVVIVGALPVAAAAGGSRTGQQAVQKMIGWTIALLLFKPVAGMCYAIAFITLDSVKAEDNPQLVLVGVILLTMTAAVLPALMKLVMPAVSAVGSGGSGLGMAAGAAGTAAAVAGGVGMLKGASAAGAKSGAMSGGGGGINASSTGSKPPPMPGGFGTGGGGGGGGTSGATGGGGGGGSPGGRTTGAGQSDAGGGSGGSGGQTSGAQGGGSGAKAAGMAGGAAAGGAHSAEQSADDIGGGNAPPPPDFPR
ncbi:hypothetical protein [Tomitella gaofuii]|uniref:hypothetical protein n=1 Tax=Tomitella gaofuii TaxID=2760083 RepID=UPI0015F870E5|nr:hypothetical protein [Tomitella gaofuii]